MRKTLKNLKKKLAEKYHKLKKKKNIRIEPEKYLKLVIKKK